MIKNGIGGANTNKNGLAFEAKARAKNTKGIKLDKDNLYHYLNKQGIDWKSIISSKLKPDDCYLDKEADEFRIYEKKYQSCSGSVDEKIQTCAFKIHQFKKLANALGVNKVTYTYIFNDWFKQNKYKDALEWIRSIPGCDYYFSEE